MGGLVDAAGKPLGAGPAADKSMFANDDDRADWFIEQFGGRVVSFLNNCRGQGIPIPRVIQFIVDGRESVIATDASAQKAVEEQLRVRQQAETEAKAAGKKPDGQLALFPTEAGGGSTPAA